ncbi:MAG: hypothetical protein IMW98_04930 [Firmicutes bacterium]|nr:hypothetical protein [Bacillota bacterium]
MASAYTPGLKVTGSTRIRKTRRLPIPGEVLVRAGDTVRPDTVVARALLPGNPQTLNLANLLGAQPSDIVDYMLKKQGEAVAAGEPIARSRGFFGLGAREVRSPISGTIELVSTVTGQLTLREPPIPVEIQAYIHGRVVEILEREGVTVETSGALIQGIFGVGGERFGTLRVVVERPTDELDETRIRPEHKGCVVVGGSLVTRGALRKAGEVGVAGIVVGGIVDVDLVEYVGHDIGVAITGQEDVPATLIVTEGFGPMAMAERTFQLLRRLEGREASINGATQIRAGVMRPEVVVSTASAAAAAVSAATAADAGAPGAADPEDEATVLDIGTRVRVIREPFFGRLGVVTALPPELTPIETEARVRVVTVQLRDSGETITIPRANVEILAGE